jgi:hypothetical protein
MHNEGEPKQAQPPRKGLSVLVKALLITAVPTVVLSVVGTGLAMATGRDAYSAIAGVGGLVWVAAVVACVAFAIARRGQIALGILAGLAIGAVGMGLTCFAPN